MRQFSQHHIAVSVSGEAENVIERRDTCGYEGRFPFALSCLSLGIVFGIGETLSSVELQRLHKTGYLFYPERMKSIKKLPRDTAWRNLFYSVSR